MPSDTVIWFHSLTSYTVAMAQHHNNSCNALLWQGQELHRKEGKVD